MSKLWAFFLWTEIVGINSKTETRKINTVLATIQKEAGR